MSSKIPDSVVNKNLYTQVKKEAKEKFERFPSIYASSWITREYKKRGGKYKSGDLTKGQKSSGLSKWYLEKWVQVLPYLEEDKIINCGAPNKHTKACRPLNRVDKSTPLTISELLEIHGKKRLIEKAKEKNKDMSKRINWKSR